VIAQLESQTGARLLNRSSRHLSPTESGELYYAQCRQALDLLDAADAAIQRDASTPRGQLKVTAPNWCANPRFVQTLADYRDAYPDVIVDLRLENRRVDLVTEGLDLALRASLDPAPTLFARLICLVPFHAVASPDYLARKASGRAKPGSPGSISSSPAMSARKSSRSCAPPAPAPRCVPTTRP
jgi:DNA-binding transcriptional LysR family regulator